MYSTNMHVHTKGFLVAHLGAILDSYRQGAQEEIFT